MSKNSGKAIRRSGPGEQWYYRFIINGEPFTGACNTTNKTDAEEFAAAEKRKLKAGTKVGAALMNVGDAVALWLREVGDHLKETQLKEQAEWVRDQIGAAVLLMQLSKSHITELVEARRRDTRPDHQENGKQL